MLFVLVKYIVLLPKIKENIVAKWIVTILISVFSRLAPFTFIYFGLACGLAPSCGLQSFSDITVNERGHGYALHRAALVELEGRTLFNFIFNFKYYMLILRP